VRNNCASYFRCVDSKKTSNENKKDSGNKKSGNKYLAWAFLETSVLKVIYRVILTFLIEQDDLKKQMLARGGVTLIQRFGSATNLLRRYCG